MIRVYDYSFEMDTINNIKIRDLYDLEMEAINILANFIGEFHKELYQKYRNVLYTTGVIDTILGEYRTAYYNDGKEHIFLGTKIFTMPFTHAVGVLLHEWSHIYGGDGSKEFTYALTDFIILILSHKNLIEKLNNYEKEWKTITSEVIKKNENKEKRINDTYWQRINFKNY
jgi:hypothetical protein